MAYFPVFLDLDEQAALVVGGGAAACDAVTALLAAGARVTVVAAEPAMALRQRIADGEVRQYAGCFSPALLDGQVLVVAASDNALSNRWVAEHAKRRRIPLAVPDAPELGSVRLDPAPNRAIAQRAGEVALVGAGPGDPDLLTVRALKLLRQADVVLYDRLVSEEILAEIHPRAERVSVGKQPGAHEFTQEAINALMIDYARAGRRVLRLKGGDSFIFGRGGEELEALAAAGIDFQVVPGVTAATGCAAYSGIPLTHRDYAQSCVFVTGQFKAGELNLDWPALARPAQTVVFYMGLNTLPTIIRQLAAHGAPLDRPAALVENGTRANQRVIVGTLATLPQLAEQQAVQAPTLIIVGDVVKLHESLAWVTPAAAREPLRKVG